MEPVTVLAISSSPRADGNSERLLDEAVKAAQSLGANVEKLRLRDFRIAPCVECGGCAGVGKCVVQDDFQRFYSAFIAVDRVILASPVFFMALSAQAKALVDRTQCFWERKYRMKKTIPPRGAIKRRGYLISTAGSGLSDSFDCSRKTALYFYKTIDMEFAGDVAANKLNEKGEVDSRADDLKAAFDLGLQAAAPM